MTTTEHVLRAVSGNPEYTPAEPCDPDCDPQCVEHVQSTGWDLSFGSRMSEQPAVCCGKGGTWVPPKGDPVVAGCALCPHSKTTYWRTHRADGSTFEPLPVDDIYAAALGTGGPT